MHCTKCGAELAEGAKFCVTCGASVEAAAPVQQVAAPVATAEPEKKEPFKIDVNEIKDQLIETLKPVAEFIKPFTDRIKPIISKKPVKIGIIAGVVLLAVISIVVAILTNGNGYVKLEQQTLLQEMDGEIKIVVGNKVLKDTIETDGYDSQDSSLNGKVTAVLTEEDELYVINGTKLLKVAEDVYKYELSVSGNGLAYIVKEDDAMTLYLYSMGSKKAATITDELSSTSIAIAPDGKSVAYYEENDDKEDVLMYSTGKDPVKITSAETELCGIANGGKYIYVIRENDEGEEAMYSFNTKGDSTKLGAVNSSSVRFNDSHSQIMFYNEGKTYISVNGKEAEKASSGRLSLIVAPNASSFYDSNSTTYPVSSFFDHVYSVSGDDSSSVWMIKQNADKSVKLVSKVSSARLDESAEYLYYIYDGDELRVIKISDGEKASEKCVKLADDVAAFMVTSDRKYVYYVSDDSIYSVNGQKGGRSTIVCADDAEGWAMNGKNVLYYIMDGDLYATDNGKKGSKVLGDIDGLTNTRTGIVYAANEDTIYVSNGSKKPSKLMDRE